MARTKTDASLEDMLADTQWLKALAAGLCRGGGDPEDAVQDAWVRVVRSPPDRARPARPWLAQVLRNVVRMTARASLRTRTREHRVATEADLESPSPETVLERAQMHRLVVELLTALAEPYRTTILLRYFDGHTPTEIAARMGIPAGTVRWRLDEGLRRLRSALDAKHAGRRARWRATLLLLAERPGSTPARPGWLSSCAKLGALGAGVALLGWLTAEPPRPSPAEESTLSRSTRKEETMKRNANALRTATFFAVALPALVAGAAETKKQPTRQELVQMCVDMFDRVFDCREEMADFYTQKVADKDRKAARRKALEEVIEDTRKANECEKSVDKELKRGPESRIEPVRACMQQTECKAFSNCLIPVLRKGKARRSWEAWEAWDDEKPRSEWTRSSFGHGSARGAESLEGHVLGAAPMG